MPLPSVTNTFVDGTTITAAGHNTNFSDVVNFCTDGTKDFTLNKLTLQDTLTANGAVILGNVSGDAITINGTVTGELLKAIGANTPGWVSNLGLTLSAGVLTVTDVSGAALSSSNVGFVCVPSTTAGQFKVLKVTTPITLRDDAHASSDLNNLGFGITETVAWANDVPFFLYVVNRGNTNIDGTDGNSAFFLARSPTLSTTPSAAGDIGNTTTIPVNDTQNVILLLGDSYTVANYVSLPCQLVGAVRMQWSTVTDDWTIQTLGNSDGLGNIQLEKTFSSVWSMPTNQNGAPAGGFILANGGTAPVFSSLVYNYNINREGMIRIALQLDGDGGTDGAGAVNTILVLPTSINTLAANLNADWSSSFRVFTPVSDIISWALPTTTGTHGGITFTHADVSGTALQNSVSPWTNSQFTNGVRRIQGSFSYKSY